MQFEYVLNGISFRCEKCNEKNIIEQKDMLDNCFYTRKCKCHNCGTVYKVPFDYKRTYHNKQLKLLNKGD